MCVLKLQSMAMKVLVAGDVEGNITALFKRVDAVNKKAGQLNIPPPPGLTSHLTLPQAPPHPHLTLPQAPSRWSSVSGPSSGRATRAGQITRVAGDQY